MRVKILVHTRPNVTGMMTDLKVGQYLACDEETAANLVEAGIAEYDFNHLKEQLPVAGIHPEIIPVATSVTEEVLINTEGGENTNG